MLSYRLHMPQKPPSISIFFPFLNDWGTVGSLVALSIATVSKLTDDWEVIIINDGSKSEDRQALNAIVDLLNSKLPPSPKLRRAGKTQNSKLHLKTQNLNNRIRIIDHDKNWGYGGALRSGLNAATKDLIFYTDCDAQYDPRELTKLYQALKPDISMVNGYKIKRNDPIHRIIAGKIYHYIVKFAFRLPIRDTDCDFRLVRKKVFSPSTGSGLGKVELFENTGTICVELVRKIHYYGYKISEMPVHHFWRTSGKSQFFNFRRLYKTGTNLIKLWWKLMVRKEYYS